MINRKDFFKETGILTTLAFMSSNIMAKSNQYDLVKIKGDKNPSELVKIAIEKLGGMRRFISKGDKVVVKPNIGWDRRPEFAANTNPEVVSEIVKLCYEAGASKVYVFDRTCNEPRRCYLNSGIAQLAKKAGAYVIYVDPRFFKTIKINGNFLKKWNFYIPALEADVFINVPIAKQHSLAGLTMALKNLMGVIGGNRSYLHQNLHQSLADIALVIKPKLTILDAYRILTKGGPQGGNLKYVKLTKTIIAGIDQVAIDSWGAELFPNIRKPQYIYIASKMGIGVSDYSKLNHLELNL